MMRRAAMAFFLASLLIGCSSAPRPTEPASIDVTLAAPLEEVKTAVARVLADDGYDAEWQDDQLSTGYRQELKGPWNWLYRWRFGTIKSRVEAVVTSATEDTTRLRLSVLTEGKDGLFVSWHEMETAVPQSPENRLRQIKNALHLL
jgi:hypothetical protein